MKNLENSRTIQLVKEAEYNNTQILPFPFSMNTCKKAFTTINVKIKNIKTLITGEIKPQAGDLVLCEVTRLRQHCRLELTNGRRSRMFVKDKIIVCYGNRYAPDQFESIVPENLEACHLVAGGGIASLMRHKSPKVKPATEIQPLGLIGDKGGQVLNLKDFSVINQNSNNNIAVKEIPIVLVAGSSMNAGKTTTVANVIKGLNADGFNVGAAKVTGTGSGGDLWHFLDAGVNHAIDFTDAGFVSTYLMSNKNLINVFNNLVDYLKSKVVDIIVIEVADGVLQKESKALLESKEIRQMTNAMYYCSGDSSSAIFGCQWLNDLGYDVMAISGVVSSNPLGVFEINQSIITPILMKQEMTAPGFGHKLMEKLSMKTKSVAVK